VLIWFQRPLLSNGPPLIRHFYDKERKTMKATTKSVWYWMTTGVVVFAMFSGGIAELAHRPETINGMKELGYPVYFVMILGFWKLLGSLALLMPGVPRVKEWAYAGIFFNMTGAAVSHLVCQDAAWHVVVTTGLAGLAVASWALRPESRTLGGARQDRPEPHRANPPSAVAA
jgi:DoxX-like family